MSFRKRNTVLSVASSSSQASSRSEKQAVPGLRPSPLDGRPTTSSGTASLDSLLAGHAGFPLGTSLLVEEQGTTDFSGVLLKYYAAEGLVQGHHVHVLGFGDSWKQGLPAVSAISSSGDRIISSTPIEDKMKIAWRYETLGNRGIANRWSHPFPHSERRRPNPTQNRRRKTHQYFAILSILGNACPRRLSRAHSMRCRRPTP